MAQRDRARCCRCYAGSAIGVGCVRAACGAYLFAQLLKHHDYVEPIWQPAEVVPLLPLVTAPAFIQSGYFDFMIQVTACDKFD